TYHWSNGPTTTVNSGLTAGTGGTTYTVTVTDNNSCVQTATVTISEPTPIVATPSVISQVSCNTGDASGSSSNGSIQVSASGGVSPFTYHWSNGPTTSVNSGLTAGTGGTT